MKREIDGIIYRKNSEGGWIPEEAIKPQDILRDDLVSECAEKILGLRKQMIEVKQEVNEEVERFLELVAKSYGKNLGGAKGNLQLNNYEGTLRIEKHMSENYYFNEGIHVAKKLIDDYLEDVTKNSSSDIKAIVTSAFKMRQGQLDVKSIMKLRQIEVTDPRWKEAMDIISDSLVVKSTTPSLRLYTRDNEGKLNQVTMDFSTVK